MKKVNLFFLISLFFVTTCSDGNGNNDNPPLPTCNNGQCDQGENCANCLADCPCPEGLKCQSGECVSALCGNGQCDEAQGEKCGNCLKDCPCPEDRKCGQSGACVYLTCGDGKEVCDPWENCLCVEDCPSCGQNQFCDKDGACVDASTLCGNSQCDTDWESCGSCLEDCPCPEGAQCKNGRCVEPSCGDGNCDPGENCGNCLADCPCPAEKVCNEAGACVFTPPPTCPNATCEEWEHCGNCLQDCPCPETTACNEAGSCQYICPDPEHLPAECVPAEAKRAYCYKDPPPAYCQYGFHEGDPCLTDAECQAVPPNQWPPCVCWEFCWLVGTKWLCTDGVDEDYSGMTMQAEQDNGNFCRISIPGSGVFYVKPGESLLHYPLNGQEDFVEFTADHKQIHYWINGFDRTCNLQ